MKSGIFNSFICSVLLLGGSSGFAQAQTEGSWGTATKNQGYVVTPGGFKNPPGPGEGAGVVVDPFRFLITGPPGEDVHVHLSLPDSFASDAGAGAVPLVSWTYRLGWDDLGWSSGPQEGDTITVTMTNDGVNLLSFGATFTTPGTALGAYTAAIRASYAGKETTASRTLEVPAAPLDLYPLQIGNRWIYRCLLDTDICSVVTVIGDSLFENGYRYFVLSNADAYGSRFVRKDSGAVHYVSPSTGSDEEVFRLDGRIGDTVLISGSAYMTIVLTSVDTQFVFGAQRTVYTYVLDGLLRAEIRLCDQLGPSIEWRWTDTGPPWPTYGGELVGCRIDGIEYGITLGVVNDETRPMAFGLSQNYPNPFNPSTTITYSLPVQGLVTLKVYNVLGQEIETLVHGIEGPGTKSVRFEGRGLPSGAYFYMLRAGNSSATKMLMIVK